MPANIGNQIVTLKFYDEVTTVNVNRRFKGLRPKGIYSGGYLTKITNTSVSLTPLVCEIGDGDHQVRVDMQNEVASHVVASSTPYVVLRWQYTGDSNDDYMSIVSVATPSSTDMIVGKCIYNGSTLNSISYAERANPEVMDMYLRVEPTETVELRVRIRAGRYHLADSVIEIADQKSSQFVLPTTLDKIYLLYVEHATGGIAIDSSGVESLTPVAPDYKGKQVLAEITLTPTSTNITDAEIKDVRSFLIRSYEPDNVTVQVNADGKLEVLDPPDPWPGYGLPTGLDSLGSPIRQGYTYIANSDGFLNLNSGMYHCEIYSYFDGIWNRVSGSAENDGPSGGPSCAFYPVTAGELIKIAYYHLITVWWKPIGPTGRLVKQ